MTIGIYKLNFKGTDKVYIGQSKNIESRFNSHISALRAGYSTKKLLEAYNSFGTPTIEILCECRIEELNDFENETIEIYNAVDNGFNASYTAGNYPPNPGQLNSQSIYDNSKIIEVFLLLIQNIPCEIISNKTGVKISTIHSISSCHNHKWLATKYPEEYNILLNRKGRNTADEVLSAKARGIIYPEIVSPDGISYSITNLNKFARDHNLNVGNLRSVLIKERHTHKGWHL